MQFGCIGGIRYWKLALGKDAQRVVQGVGLALPGIVQRDVSLSEVVLRDGLGIIVRNGGNVEIRLLQTDLPLGVLDHSQVT